jgi:hypothetical protein
MAIDFSSLDATPAKTGKIDFSAIGGIPAVGQDEPIDETTALGAAGRGAVGMLPMGTQAYSALAGAAENKPYLQERKEVEKEIQSDIASHEPSRLMGQAAGIAAPALLTGGSSVPATLGEAAGQGAAIGAGFGAGNAIDTLASGGSGGQAVGQVALGAGLGAAGGAAGQKLAGLAGEAVPGLETYAAKKAAQGVGMGSEELGNMTQPELIDTGKMLMQKGIIKPGASTQEMFDAAKAMQDQYGDQIGQIGNKAGELGLHTDIKPLLDSLDAKYQAASMLQNPDEMRNANFYKKGMADILTMARQNISSGVASNEEGMVPQQIYFDQLQRLKKSYGNSAFMNGTVKNPAAADVYSALSAGQKSIVASAADNPNLTPELKDAMAGYSKLHPVVDGLQDVLGRERAGNMPAKGFGMIGKLVGQLPGQQTPAINALTSLGLLGAGHPLWAIGAATATLQNPRAMSNLAQGVANRIPSIAGALPTVGAQIAGGAVQQNMGETKPVHITQGGGQPATISTAVNIDHPALAQWKSTFQKNAAQAKNTGEVQKSNAVTDFVLSQRDPAYAAAKQKANDAPVAQNTAAPTGMADGGIVPDLEDKFGKPVPGFGSTLPGLASQMANPTHETPPAPTDTLPTSTTQKFNQPFNTAMEEKLKEFLRNSKEKNNAGS